MASARGGYTDVCTMPNLNPVPDSYENLKLQLDAIKEKAQIGVHPYGSITVEQKGEALAALDEMADYCVAFSDDGRGVQSEALMEEAKKTAYETMMKCYDRNIYDWGTIKNRVRDDVSKLMYERTKRSPMILPILMEI